MDGSARYSGRRQQTWSTSTAQYDSAKGNRSQSSSPLISNSARALQGEGLDDAAEHLFSLAYAVPETSKQYSMQLESRQGQRTGAVNAATWLPTPVSVVCTESKGVQTSFTFPPMSEWRVQASSAESKRDNAAQVQSDDECITGSPNLQVMCTVTRPEASSPFEGRQLSGLASQGGALKQRNMPCNEASLQHLAWRSTPTPCTAPKVAVDKNLNLFQKLSAPSFPAASLCLHTVNSGWSVPHLPSDKKRATDHRYPKDVESLSLKTAVQADMPVPSAHPGSPEWRGTNPDQADNLAARSSAAEHSCSAAMHVAPSSSNIAAVRTVSGTLYPSQQATASDRTVPHIRDQTVQRPVQSAIALNLRLRHLGARARPAGDVHHAVSSAIGKADEAVLSLRGDRRLNSELPPRSAVAVGRPRTPALGLPRGKEQPLHLWHGRSHSLPRPAHVHVALSPKMTAPSSAQGPSAQAPSAAAVSMQRPAPCSGAYGVCRSPRPAQAEPPTVHKVGGSGSVLSPAHTVRSASTAAPWAETLRNKLRQLKAHRGSSPVVKGSVAGKKYQAHDESKVAWPKAPAVTVNLRKHQGFDRIRQLGEGRTLGMTPGYNRSRSAPGRAGCHTPLGHLPVQDGSSGTAAEWRIKAPAMQTPVRATENLRDVNGGHARAAVPGAAVLEGRGRPRQGSSALPPRRPTVEAGTTSPWETGAVAREQSRHRSPCVAEPSPPVYRSPGEIRTYSVTRGRCGQRAHAAESPRSLQNADRSGPPAQLQSYGSISPRPGAGRAASDVSATAKYRNGQGAARQHATGDWRHLLHRQAGVPKCAATTLADRLRAAQACTAAGRSVSRHDSFTSGESKEAVIRQKGHPLKCPKTLAYLQARTTRHNSAAVEHVAGQDVAATPKVCPAFQSTHSS